MVAGKISLMMRIRKWAFAVLLMLSGISGFWLASRYVIPIVVYHSVNFKQSPDYQANTVHPDIFLRQMDYFKRNGYNVISLDALVKATTERRKLPPKSVVITFDDGYEDNYTQAFPVLKKYGFPAVVFVAVTKVGEPGWLTWEQAREMEKNNIIIESHTLSHPYLPEVSGDQRRFEVEESKKILEQKLSHRIDYIAYPSGGFNEDIKRIVKQAGYQGACTTNRGHDRLNRDVYELKRIRLSDKDSSLSLWFKLSGFYDSFRDTKPSH